MAEYIHVVDEPVNNSESEIELSIDPDFIDRTGELHPELVSDYISILLKENRDRIESVDVTYQLFMNPKIVQYLFTICLRLRLPHDVQYIAIGLFNDFMISHITGLYETIVELADKNEEERSKEWEKVESTVSRQLTLRILSCIQVASKMHSYNDSLSAKRVKRCLQLLGLSYTEEAVRKSEIRVLMTLGFHSLSTNNPLVFVESLLNALYKEMALFLNGNKIWEYSLLLMDCVFLQLELVYRRILLIVHGKEAQYLPKDRIYRVQSDYMLLATGILSAACVCVHGMDIGDKAIAILSCHSRISSDDVLDMSTAIMKTILEHKKASSLSSFTSSATDPTNSNNNNNNNVDNIIGNETEQNVHPPVSAQPADD